MHGILKIQVSVQKELAINLPKSPDTFTVEALAETVIVESKTGVWKPKTQSSAFLALAEKFPEIKDIQEGVTVKQGNLLPVIVSPSNVTLTDAMTYALYDVEGNVVAKLSNPVKGLTSGLDWNGNGELLSTSRSTADECFWTLEMDPVLKDGTFIGNGSEKYSLAIVKSNGAVNKTAFDYKIDWTDNVDNVLITPTYSITAKTNQDGVATIDLMKDVFSITNGYGKYYFCELATEDPATIEQYALEVKDNVLSVKFLAGVEYLYGVVKLKCTALGLNGSTQVRTITLNLSREVTATDGAFSDQEFVLTTTKNSSNQYVNKLRWNVEDLGFSPLELRNFMTGYRPQIILEYKNGDNWSHMSTMSAIFYKADGTIINPSQYDTEYTNAVTYGIDLNNTYLTPEKEYRLTLQKYTGNAITYKQEAKMIVTNPTINIAPKSDRSENGALVLWADSPEAYRTKLSHLISSELAKSNFTGTDFVTFGVFTDVDHELWEENSGEANVWGNTDWLYDGANVVVNKYDAESDNAENQAIGKPRKMSVECILFDNPENKYTYEFTVVAKSTIYSSNPASVISIDPSFATVKKGTSTKDPRPLFTAKYAEGINKDTEGKKGEKYNLFDYNLTEYYTVPDYANPKLDNGNKYLVNSDGMPVEVEKADWLNLGLTMDQYMAASKAYFVVEVDEEIQIPENGIIYISWSRVVENNGTYKAGMKDIFNKYISRIAFNPTTKDANAVKSDKIASAKFALTKAVAGVSVNETTGVITVANSVAANTNVDVKLTIVDQWGMTMEYVYTVKVTN